MRNCQHMRTVVNANCNLLALVLGGGGALGAMQVGAIRALLEAGFRPDLLVGTSIGAVNAAGLALWGVDQAGVEALERTYEELAGANLMDPHVGRLTLSALLGRPNHSGSRRAAELLIAKGITPELRFGDLKHARLAMVGTDLGTGQPVIYGRDPGQSVLDGVMASVALPPWFVPVREDQQIIIDGVIVSNLPIEPALTMGATSMIALNLITDPADLAGNNRRVNQDLGKIAFAVIQRQFYLERALAESHGVPVHRVDLTSSTPTALWDFSTHRDLIQVGYQLTVHEIARWKSDPQREAASS